MKDYSITILASLLILISVQTSAQKKIGYVFGINLATLDINAQNITTPPKTTVNIIRQIWLFC